MRRRSGLVALVVVLSGLAACGDDDDKGVQAAGDGESLATVAPETDGGPRLGDHWHLAVGFSRCGEELPVLEDVEPDTTGIHSHADGLIHVHPFTDDATGSRAVLGRFFDTVGAATTEEGLETAEWSLPFEGECDGEPATLSLTTWPIPEAGGSMSTRAPVGSAEQLRSIPLRPDGSMIAIALSTEDQEIPPPPSASALESPADVVASASPPLATGQGTPADVEFGLAPVLGVGEPPCGDTTTPSTDGSACYELGPLSLGAEAIASAEAQDDGFGWGVFIQLTPEGDDAFDVAATACFEQTAECPSGMLAIVVDGEVRSAPTVHSPTFDGELTISGDFTEADARELADVLSA